MTLKIPRFTIQTRSLLICYSIWSLYFKEKKNKQRFIVMQIFKNHRIEPDLFFHFSIQAIEGFNHSILILNAY